MNTYDNTEPTSSRGFFIAAASISAAAIVAIVAVVGFALGGHFKSAAAPAPTPTHTVTPATPVTPKPVPSAAVETLQKQLGQLNYYEGPIDGLMGPQTTAAITYLQRDAGLPQTGTMNAATQAALQNFLVNGNNQMAG
jgi:peptidoglycan hydrolase-like protein with peptidoglycan-binding domain